MPLVPADRRPGAEDLVARRTRLGERRLDVVAAPLANRQREITRATSVPIAAGENEYTRYGFRDMINARAVDILQPDALVLGGVTEFMKIAALAQANDLDLAPHGNQEVHIHLVCAIPNGLSLEYYADKFDAMHGNVFKDTLEIKDGYVYAPDRAGLGMELNSEFLATYRVG